MSDKTKVVYPLSYGFQIANDGTKWGFLNQTGVLQKNLTIDGKNNLFNQDRIKEPLDVAEIQKMLVDLVQEPRDMKIQKKYVIAPAVLNAGVFSLNKMSTSTDVIEFSDFYSSEDYYRALKRFLFPYITIEVKKQQRLLYFNDLDSLMRDSKVDFNLLVNEAVTITLSLDSVVDNITLEQIRNIITPTVATIGAEDTGVLKTALVNEQISESAKAPTGGAKIVFRGNLKLLGAIISPISGSR